MYDLIVRNGTIVDGTGAPATVGDIGVKDGRIAHVGGRIDAEAVGGRADEGHYGMAGMHERAKLPAGACFVTPQGHIVTQSSVRFYAADAESDGTLSRLQEIENIGNAANTP